MKFNEDIMFHLGSNNEFDLYFARAALEEEMENGGIDSRRGSLPSAPPNKLIIPEAKSPRRASSCKYPSRARRKKGGSTSPRERDGTPARTLQEDVIIPSDEDVQLNNTNNNPQLQLPVHPQLDHRLLAPGPRLDFKCHSAPHSRSGSWKKARRPQSNKFSETDTPESDSRSRTGSVPFEESISARLEQLRLLQADDCCVVRNFATSSRGLINRGDSFKRKSFSVASDQGSVGSGLGEGDHAHSLPSIGDSTAASSGGTQIVRVALMGSTGVGKTALLQQFLTSEYMGAMETSFDDEREKTVSVLLDGEETMLDLIDLQTIQDHTNADDIEAYVIVYSITDQSSFTYAVDLINDIRLHQPHNPAIILVANKSDLVRSKQVTSDEGRQMCLSKNCKYIEVSAVLNHKVDDLLVGIVSQIRLYPDRMEQQQKGIKEEPELDTTCTTGAKGLLQKLFKRKHMYVSKSCDNLLVL